MNAVSRRGACPALSAPMQTGDGLLVRLNPVAGKDGAGGLSPKTLIGLCESALRHGNGIMEVTARGSIQIRGLTPSSARALADEVNTLGIAVRTGVPVETGPLAGLDPDEIADPRPLAEAIRTAIADAGLSPRLGPKVSVVVDGGGRLTMDTVIADVRLVAVAPQVTCAGTIDKTAWLLAIGGDAATARRLGVISESDAADAVVAILEQIAAYGIEGRARDLTSSLRGGSEVELSNATFAGRGGGESTLHPRPASLALLPQGAFRDPARKGEGKAAALLGPVPLKDRQHAVAIALPFGSMPAERIIGLAEKAMALGAAEIRPALGRALLFLGLSSQACATLQQSAAALGFVTDPADPRLYITACPGTPACASGQIETRTIAEAIAANDRDMFDGSFTLHVSGCAKGCAHPTPAALTLVGGENGAGLVVDATAKTLPAGYVPRYDAARSVQRIARRVRTARRTGETTAACLARLGAAAVTTAFVQD